ncbi:hypothetical protein JCM10212_001234 [Sporobolomyces blumeae]
MSTVESTRRPHPLLSSPVLYVDGLVQSVTDEEIVQALSECLRLRLRLDRTNAEEDPRRVPLTGSIEFESLDQAEKAYATTNGQTFPLHDCSLSLHLSRPPPSTTTAAGARDPVVAVPTARPRLLKSLPRTFTSGQVYTLCRPFGPIASCSLQLSPSGPRGTSSSSLTTTATTTTTMANGPVLPLKFKGQAIVTWYDEADAERAMQGLHFLEVAGQNIAIALWDERRAGNGRARRSDTSRRSSGGGGGGQDGRTERGSKYPATTMTTTTTTSEPSRIQSRYERTSRWASDPAHSSADATTTTRPSADRSTLATTTTTALSANAREFVSPVMSRNVSGASRWSSDTRDTSINDDDDGDGNLFIKSLPPSLTSSSLRSLFAPFGTIVSARVMTDPVTGQSKEFGFVSFTTADEARNALNEMDGKRIEARYVTVRVHEPKKVRQGRLSGATGQNGTRVSDSGDALDEATTRIENLSTTDTSPTPQLLHAIEQTPDAGRASSSPPPPSAVANPPPSEHDRLVSAVRDITLDKVGEVVALLEGLPKKERVMCLFNPQVLEQKVQDALLILADDDEPERTPSPVQPLKDDSTTAPNEPVGESTPTTLPRSIADLATLPCSSIVPLLPLLTSTLSLSRPAQEDLDQARTFVRGLEEEGLGKSQVKQKLGERLFKVIKGTGVKRAPKITIDLLDSEDLDSLALLVHYPEILKEKALRISSASASAKTV